MSSSASSATSRHTTCGGAVVPATAAPRLRRDRVAALCLVACGQTVSRCAAAQHFCDGAGVRMLDGRANPAARSSRVKAGWPARTSALLDTHGARARGLTQSRQRAAAPRVAPPARSAALEAHLWSTTPRHRPRPKAQHRLRTLLGRQRARLRSGGGQGEACRAQRAERGSLQRAR